MNNIDKDNNFKNELRYIEQKMLLSGFDIWQIEIEKQKYEKIYLEENKFNEKKSI